MNNQKEFNRRQLLKTVACGIISVQMQGTTNINQGGETAPRQQLPIKIGTRQTSLRDPNNPKQTMMGNFDTFKVARQIPGILGIELQCAGYRNNNLRDLNVVRRFKFEAHRWGLDIPSTAGIWDPGTLKEKWGPAAGIDLLHSIRANEILGASVMLVAFFSKNAPDMNDESSYGPLIDLFKKAVPYAADAGIIMGFETSLSPVDNKKFVDLIDHPAAKIYYDPDNMAHYGYAEQAIPGIKLLGNERICMVHVKNQDNIIDVPGRINWAEALQACSDIGYPGWFVFETRHENYEQCIKDTIKNIDFIETHFQPQPG